METSITKISSMPFDGSSTEWEHLRYIQSDSVKIPVYEPESINHELYFRRGYKLFWRNPITKKKTIQFTITKEEFECSGLKIGDVKMVRIS